MNAEITESISQQSGTQMMCTSCCVDGIADINCSGRGICFAVSISDRREDIEDTDFKARSAVPCHRRGATYTDVAFGGGGMAIHYESLRLH
jgi:hypothetical protein